MIYSVFSIICIILLAVIAIGYVLAICTKGRSKRIDFIRKFKKGNCAIVYMVAIPLYWMGHVYAGQSLFSALTLSRYIVILLPAVVKRYAFV